VPGAQRKTFFLNATSKVDIMGAVAKFSRRKVNFVRKKGNSLFYFQQHIIA
jgi:hypothetical protein